MAFYGEKLLYIVGLRGYIVSQGSVIVTVVLWHLFTSYIIFVCSLHTVYAVHSVITYRVLY
jgi:hypothetical protein